MNNFAWKITGRSAAGFSPGGPPPENWRDLLATRLGQRPRRIGVLAELALYGALECLDAAKERELPGDVLLRVCSMGGPVTAISQVLEQNREDLPLPFSFLQSQTSQILPALAAALNWQGDAGVVMSRNSLSLALLACRQAEGCGVLLGWVEEKPCRSYWIRLVPCTAPTAGFTAASSIEEMVSASMHYWRSGREGMEIAP